ncbi:hypothetical protein A2291_06345 [candidate division WOR-1 bacterium RIFOXYB2_FULL_42_35]|uniref:AB hydrolase-1 domain-containing protein n=1 Tax=candidate division WOR-1 bacterium RIFOXYC2_FULL_41_25 TaxID=1802586 RepID=A0A1F4TTP6_UNCSA|nr:MAG: hypothetical protein A2247_00050 [candidate division WOR-1 bacterium RIFOXYA2_FULL_41_14]OGC27394.1 MAG: hypothetical protein A2291_06345 [candidate division WOR-1 bacterium RIFOXYB2_FULL_42_35]OGC35433.1 MAG: hypothetical protein A2462_03005 [candidate division WOR-1 bacterium RIFOXYC2_FULL_41_25]
MSKTYVGDLSYYARQVQSHIKRSGLKNFTFSVDSNGHNGKKLSLDSDVYFAFRRNGIETVDFVIAEGIDYPDYLLQAAIKISLTHLALKKKGGRRGVEYLDLTKRLGQGRVRLARLKISYQSGANPLVEFDCAEVANKKEIENYPSRELPDDRTIIPLSGPGYNVERQTFTDGSRAFIYSPSEGNPKGTTVMPRLGYSMSAVHDHPLAAALSSRGYRSVVFDYPGHSTYSASPFARGNYDHLSLNNFAASTQEKVAWVREKFGGEVAFVGQSMSGRIGLDLFAGQEAEKKPDKLFMVAPFGFAFMRTKITGPFLLAMGVNLLNLFRLKSFALTAAMSYRYFFNQEESPSDFAKFWQSVQPVPVRISWELAATALGGPINNFLANNWVAKKLFNYSFAEPDIGRQPVRIIENQADVIASNASHPILADCLKRKFGAKDVKVISFPEGVHNSPVTQADPLADLIIRNL